MRTSRRLAQGVAAAVGLLLQASAGYAFEHIKGNGGDAVVCYAADGSIASVEVLDHYEARQNHIVPGLGPEIGPTRDAQVLSKVDYVLARIQAFDPVRVAIYRDLAARFLQGEANLVAAPLADIPDSAHVFEPPVGCELKQLAVQPEDVSDFPYYVYKTLYDRLDTDNQATIILHEIIYRRADPLGHLDSRKIRHFVGALLDPNIARRFDTPAAYQRFLQQHNLDYWPQTFGDKVVDFNFHFSPQGRLTAVGTFTDTMDFNPRGETHKQFAVGGTDLFFAAYEPDGTLARIRTLGWRGNERLLGTSARADGTFAVYGEFLGELDFDFSFVGERLLKSDADPDYFVAVYDADFNLVFANRLPHSSTDLKLFGIHLADDGVVHCSGNFTGRYDFDPGAGVDSRTSAGYTDAFLLKLAADGAYLSTTVIGSTYSDGDMGALAGDQDGNIYWLSSFKATVDLDPGPAKLLATARGNSDAFVAKFAADGRLLWGGSVGSDAYDYFNAIAVDAMGQISLVGMTQGAAVDVDPNASVDLLPVTGAGWNIVALGLGADGRKRWAWSAGGDGDQLAWRGFPIDGRLYVSSTYTGSFVLGGRQVLGSDGSALLFEVGADGVVGQVLPVNTAGTNIAFNVAKRRDGTVYASGLTGSPFHLGAFGHDWTVTGAFVIPLVR